MRYDLVSPRKDKNGKTHWHNVGVAFDRDNGGFAMEFNSLPLPDETGKVFVLMSEHKSREERQSGGQQAAPSQPAGGGGTSVDDDSIPFGPEVRV